MRNVFISSLLLVFWGEWVRNFMKHSQWRPLCLKHGGYCLILGGFPSHNYGGPAIEHFSWVLPHLGHRISTSKCRLKELHVNLFSNLSWAHFSMDIIKNSSAWLKKNRIIVVRFASSTINCTVFVKSLKLFCEER